MKQFVKWPTFLCMLWLFGSAGCKKIVDDLQEQAAYDIITQGQWEVSKFEINTTSITTEYEGYAFQFFTSGRVIAIRSGESNVEGTWSGNVNNLSITSSFPGAPNPLARFNGVWMITRTTETTVQANRTLEGGTVFYLGLRKI